MDCAVLLVALNSEDSELGDDVDVVSSEGDELKTKLDVVEVDDDEDDDEDDDDEDDSVSVVSVENPSKVVEKMAEESPKFDPETAPPLVVVARPVAPESVEFVSSRRSKSTKFRFCTTNVLFWPRISEPVDVTTRDISNSACNSLRMV